MEKHKSEIICKTGRKVAFLSGKLVCKYHQEVMAKHSCSQNG